MRGTLELLAALGVEPATIADVGASDGRWSQCARATFPAAGLVLFEPHPAHVKALDRFQIKNVEATIIRSAVGATVGTSLFDATDPWGGALQDDRTSGSIEVPVVTLDDALAAVEPPLLVKLDTHGVERAILSGARQTLDRSVAWIIEAYNQRITSDCLLFWELCDQMAEHGFRPIDLVDVHHRPYDGTLWQMDLSFVRSDWEGFRRVGYDRVA